MATGLTFVIVQAELRQHEPTRFPEPEPLGALLVQPAAHGDGRVLGAACLRPPQRTPLQRHRRPVSRLLSCSVRHSDPTLSIETRATLQYHLTEADNADSQLFE